jgi:hypothetical protein
MPLIYKIKFEAYNREVLKGSDCRGPPDIMSVPFQNVFTLSLLIVSRDVLNENNPEISSIAAAWPA